MCVCVCVYLGNWENNNYDVCESAYHLFTIQCFLVSFIVA